ncbi:MAG: hypothetical protein ACRES8_00790 [Nevskiaceae bacterium]
MTTPGARSRGANPAIAAAACIGLAACAYTSSSPFASYPELPPPSQRLTVGLWDLGDDNCKGSIQTTAGTAYWVIDCRVKAGHGHCTHGLPLVDRGARRYASAHGRITFAIQEDGGLEEMNNGKLYRHYSRIPGQICGAGSSPTSDDAQLP